MTTHHPPRLLTDEFAELKNHERHANGAETAYWCNQYKLFAQRVLAALAAAERAREEAQRQVGDTEKSLVAACQGLSEENARLRAALEKIKAEVKRIAKLKNNPQAVPSAWLHSELEAALRGERGA